MTGVQTCALPIYLMVSARPYVCSYFLVLVAEFCLSNYTSAEEACGWTVKREAELRDAEREGVRQEKRGEWRLM